MEWHESCLRIFRATVLGRPHRRAAAIVHPADSPLTQVHHHPLRLRLLLRGVPEAQGAALATSIPMLLVFALQETIQNRQLLFLPWRKQVYPAQSASARTGHHRLGPCPSPIPSSHIPQASRFSADGSSGVRSGVQQPGGRPGRLTWTTLPTTTTIINMC